MDKPGYTVGSGNVFADLGFEHPEQELAKAKLVMAIQRTIDRLGWTTDQAAQRLGEDPTDFAALLRGRFGRTEEASLRGFLAELDATEQQ